MEPSSAHGSSADPPFSLSSFIRPDHDTELLQRGELRSIRLGLELLKPELKLGEHGIRSTIVVFGSARLQEPSTAQRALQEVERLIADDPSNPSGIQELEQAKRQVAPQQDLDDSVTQKPHRRHGN